MKVAITSHARQRIEERLLPFIEGDAASWAEREVLAGLDEHRFAAVPGDCHELVVKAGEHDVRMVCKLERQTAVVVTVVIETFVRNPPDLKHRQAAMRARRRTNTASNKKRWKKTPGTGAR